MTAPLVLPDTLEQLDFRPGCEVGTYRNSRDTPCSREAEWVAHLSHQCADHPPMMRTCDMHRNQIVAAAMTPGWVTTCSECGFTAAIRSVFVSWEPLR